MYSSSDRFTLQQAKLHSCVPSLAYYQERHLIAYNVKAICLSSVIYTRELSTKIITVAQRSTGSPPYRHCSSAVKRKLYHVFTHNILFSISQSLIYKKNSEI